MTDEVRELGRIMGVSHVVITVKDFVEGFGLHAIEVVKAPDLEESFQQQQQKMK